MRFQSKRGFTLIELLVVIAIIAILASILFPVFAKAREKARQTTCLSQIRQLATAVQMYNQDNNGRFPGSVWATAIATYLGDSTKMFYCPSDSASDTETVISYGYAGILIRADGTGVNEAQIKSPTEVGVVCDASPSKAYTTGGGLVGGGGLGVEETIGVIPASRHSGGVIVGYCDGHAKYVPKAVNEKDLDNAVTKAFYAASALGLVDNPAGGLSSCAPTVSGAIAIGGEYATMPLITALAEAAKKVNAGTTYFTRGFLGGNSAGKPTTGTYVWGRAATTSTVGATSVIGHDAVLLVVAKSSQIAGIKSILSNNTYVQTTVQINAWGTDVNAGYLANSIQVYSYPSTTDTYQYAIGKGMSMFAAANRVEVLNDAEMVDKVANDPYGVGVISSVFFDPSRLVALSFSATDVFPQANAKYRFQMPAGGSNYSWKRELYLGTGTAAAAATDMTTGGFSTALKNGPLFKCSYW